MSYIFRGCITLFIIGLYVSLSSCGGDGNSKKAQPVETFEIIDPNRNELTRFGKSVNILSNNRVLVGSGDLFVGGTPAFYLYDVIKQKLLATILKGEPGEPAEAIPLANSNFILLYPQGDVGAVTDAGTVMLYGSASGDQITIIAGNDSGDGQDLQIHPSGENFIINRKKDDVNGLVDAGSVLLVDAKTGEVIKQLFEGDDAGDGLAMNVQMLENGNFVVVAPNDDHNGLVDVGSISLFDGQSGKQIGDTIRGSLASDRICSNSVFVFASGNFVCHSQFTGSNVGALHFIDGESANYKVMAGARSGDMAAANVLELNNGNYAIGLPKYDIESGGLLADVGMITVMTPAGFFSPYLLGDQAGDHLGHSLEILDNGNFVAASPDDDVGMIDNGSVRLMSAATGVQIGQTILGDNPSDGFGYVVAVKGGNFFLTAPNDSIGGAAGKGSIRLISGVNAELIGNINEGVNAGDNLGYSYGITLLSNGSLLYVNGDESVGGLTQSGSIRFYNSETGAQIGDTFSGEEFESIGASIYELPNGNIVVRSLRFNDTRGRYIVFDSTTAEQIGPGMIGNEANDIFGTSQGNTFILENGIVALPTNENLGPGPSSGAFRFLNSTTGKEIEEFGPVAGLGSLAVWGFKAVLSPDQQFMVVYNERQDTDGLRRSGWVQVINLRQLKL